MRYIVIVLLFLLINFSMKAQEAPMKKIAQHLIQSGEMPVENPIDKVFERISLGKYFETDAKALYCFSSTSVHRYYFILLRNKDTFQILNCNNFIKEYELMEKWFSNDATDSLQSYTNSIIQLYKHNYNYHPTPPIAPPMRDKNGEMIEPKYLPRKLIKSIPFKYSFIKRNQ